MQLSYDALNWEQSAWRPGRLDSNMDAYNWLVDFFELNGDRVAKVCD